MKLFKLFKRKTVFDRLHTVTRVEVIDGHGRSYVKHGVKETKLSFQDNDRTLKVFLTEDKNNDVVESIFSCLTEGKQEEEQETKHIGVEDLNQCEHYGIPCKYVLTHENAPVPCFGSQEQCDAWRAAYSKCGTKKKKKKKKKKGK